MAPMNTSPSLPRLLSLDKDFKRWGERLQEAADIAGIPLEAGLDDSQIQKLACRSAAHGRAELVLRTLLEKLKTTEGRQKSRSSPLTFVLLRRLLLFVPPATSAQLFNSNNILDIIKNYLEETAARIGDGLDQSNQTMDSGSSVTLEDSQPSPRKRKRSKSDDDARSTKTSADVAKDEQENLASLGLFIDEIIHLSTSSAEDIDPVAAQHLKSVIRTSTAEAADILSEWLHCLLLLCQSHGTDASSELNMEAIMRTHFAITRIWSSRSLEIDDDSGSSASTFSRACLVYTVGLYAQIRHDAQSHESQLPLVNLKTSLEQLLARHVFVPGRASFSTMSDRKRTKMSDNQNPLMDLLQPLHAMTANLISEGEREHDSLRNSLSILPSLLEQAIKLCPSNSPKQKLADSSWIECVVKSLSWCGGESIPFEESDSPKSDVSLSPLQNMLRIVQKSQINLGTVFLESVLLGYSGLHGINERKDIPVRWGLVTVLLEMGGSVFMKEKLKDNPAQSVYTDRIPPHVEALVRTMKDTTWEPSLLLSSPDESRSPNSLSSIPQWSNSVDDAVEKVLVPLMRAYDSTRNLNGFMDLWSRELRGSWMELGSKNERVLPWASEQLRQNFQTIVETSLTPARINERLVENIVIIKTLLDYAASAAEPVKWADLEPVAPASVSLFMVDTLLHGIQNAEILQANNTTWKALKDVSTQFAATDIKKFACSYKVWSILTQIHALYRRVDGEKAFQEQLVSLSSSDILEGALSVVGEVRPHQVDGFQFEAAREAYRFAIIVGSDLLEVPGLKERAEHYISTANNFLLHSVSRFNPAQVFQLTQSKEEQALSSRLKSSLAVLIACPKSLSVFSPHERCGIFEIIFYHAAMELDLNVSSISFPTLLEALAEAVMLVGGETKEDFTLTLVSMFDKAKTYKHSGLRRLALDVLLQLPVTAMTRKERESMMDKFLASFTIDAGQGPSKETGSADLDSGISTNDCVPFFSKELSLMIRSLEQPNPTSELCIDATQVWKIARACDQQAFGENVMKTILLDLEALFNAVIRQAIIDATVDRKKVFATKFAEQASSIFTSTSLVSQLATMFLLKSWVHVESETKSTAKPENPSDATEFLQKTLNRDIALVGEGAVTNVQQWAIFRTLSELPLAAIESEVHNIKEILRSMNYPDAELVKAVISSGADPSETMQVLTHQLQDDMTSPQDHVILMEAFEDQLRLLRPAKRVSLLNDLIRSSQKTSERGTLQLLASLINSLTQDDSAVFVEKGSLLIKLCQRLLSSKDIGHFGTSISCINTILRTKAWLVNQHGIDTLLSTLTTLASSRAQPLPKEHAPIIYLRLCQTATSIVLLHRKHLGGRMHLLVPLLQNLLTCLFKPHRHQGPRSAASSPPWLFNSSSPLTNTHSKAYTRLLSTLCSPTSSSTSSHRRHAELTDTNKQAREYAGQYVPYVLMHYCSLQLGASMDSEVREGLKAGIWEMMAVVGIEGMRGMNVGMGRDERVVWGVVYNEWLRVGRGRSS